MASASSVLLAAALCSTLFVACLATPTSRILDGGEAGTDNFPYVVSVRLDDTHVCGGSIIGQEYILTAAHCVSQLGTTPVAANRVSIRAGSTNQYAGGKLYSISAISIHNDYGSFLNDVAVLKVASKLELGARVQVIALADSNEAVAARDVVTIAGWGRTISGGAYAFKLQYDDATVISSADCEESIGYGYPSTLCLQHEPGKGACNGDAGGPAVFNNRLVGVSNFVIGSCGTKYPDVFARASHFNSWINAIINAA